MNMETSKYLITILIISLMASILKCTNNIAGSEVTNEKAFVYMPGGKSPAVAAKIAVVPVDYIPDNQNSDIYETETDGKGSYTIDGIPTGFYNIIAQKDSLSSYQDSVFLGSADDLRNDTLDFSGSLSARIVMQPNHDPQSAVIQVLGTTNYFSNVDNSGWFTLKNQPAGSYQLRIVTTEPQYTPTFENVVIRAGKSDTLQEPIHLIYTGIPVVSGLRAVYNPVSSVICLSWNPVNYHNFGRYLVYCGITGFSEPLDIIASTENIVFYDTLSRLGIDTANTPLIGLRYQVAVETGSLVEGEKSNAEEVTVVFTRKAGILLAVDTLTFTPGSAFKLNIKTDSSLGEVSSYSYRLRGDEDFKEISGPETTIVIDAPADSVFNGLYCIVKVTNSEGINVFDTLILQSRMKWEQTASPFDDTEIGYYSLVFNGKLLVFTQSGAQNAVALWSSENGTDWQKKSDSLPYRQLTKPPLVFDDRIIVMERDSALASAVIWSSIDGLNWNSKQMDSLPNAGFSTDYEVWCTDGDRIDIINYFPDCLKSNKCKGVPNSWSSLDGRRWESSSVKGSLFPDWLDTPNKYFTAFRMNGSLYIGGAWRTLYLTSPASAAYYFKVWNQVESDPLKLPFPVPRDQATVGTCNPVTVIFRGSLFMSAQINMESSTEISNNTSYLWKLMQDSSWVLCSDTYPAVNNSEMKSNYHSLVEFKNRLYSISRSGVWRAMR